MKLVMRYQNLFKKSIPQKLNIFDYNKIFFIRLIYFVSITLLSSGFLNAQEKLFELRYLVYFKGWPCGQMISTLVKDDLKYEYVFEQITKSSVLFYSFQQREKSVFIIENNKLIGISYDKEKKEFNSRTQESLVYDSLPSEVFGYDPLSMQFALIESVEPEKYPPLLNLPVWKNKELNNMQFESSKDTSGNILFSHEKNKRITSFVLSPAYHYLPISFEQKKNGECIFSGALVQAEISPSLMKNAPFLKKSTK